MNTDLQIQNIKLELIQRLTTIEDLSFLQKISDLVIGESHKDWADNISEAERQSIERGIEQANEGKLNLHSKAKAIYGK